MLILQNKFDKATSHPFKLFERPTTKLSFKLRKLVEKALTHGPRVYLAIQAYNMYNVEPKLVESTG